MPAGGLARGREAGTPCPTRHSALQGRFCRFSSRDGGGWVIDADLCAEAATMLDVPNCDWRTLQQIEGLLSALSTQIQRASAAETAVSPDLSSARRVGSDLLVLQSSLSWVRQHAYDALESELQNRLETALQCAADMLDQLERLRHETRTG